MRTLHQNPVLDDLADPSRRAILDHLRTGEKTVTELVEHTGLKQPNVSNHLARMRERSIVAAQRVGRQQLYRLANPLVEQVLNTALSGAGPVVLEAVTPARLQTWADAYFHAVTTSDEEAATRVVSECLTNRVPIVDLYVDVFQAALVTVGTWYMHGRLTEAQEHYATALTERLMARASHFYASAQPNGRSAVIGCVAGNWHAVGPRMISDILSHLGWQTAYLGANVPTPSFVNLVMEHMPDVVFVSCALEITAEACADLVRQLRERREGADTRFLIGIGGGFVNMRPDFVTEVKADFTAPDLRGLVTLVNNLPISPRLT